VGLLPIDPASAAAVPGAADAAAPAAGPVATAPSAPTQSLAGRGLLGNALAPVVALGSVVLTGIGVEPAAAPPLAAVETTAATQPGAEPAVGEPVPVEPPAPIDLGLRLTAPFLDATGWDEALGQLVEGVDDLLGGFEDLGGESSTLPWIVAGGLAVAASEAARRFRSRPGLAAAFVDGSASVVDPEDADRRQAPQLSDSVRRLLARGLSRWTSRR
jgi:hypothetical protein